MTLLGIALNGFHLNTQTIILRRRFFIIFLCVVCVCLFCVSPPWLSPPPLTPCKRISSSELLRVRSSKRGIPLILHQIYADARLPRPYEALVRRCRQINRDFVHVLWTDEDVAAFLHAERPELKALYYSYNRGIEKADVSRLILLHHFGGVYMDFDVECIQPLLPALDRFNASCIFDREREEQSILLWHKSHLWMNSVIVCRRKHPVFKFLLSMLPLYQGQSNVLWRTGPFFISMVMPIFFAYSSQNDSVYLASSSAFSPFTDTPKYFRLICIIIQLLPKTSVYRKACASLQNSASMRRSAILLHRFMHLGYRRHKTGSFDVCALRPPTVRYKANHRLVERPLTGGSPFVSKP